MTMFLMMWAVLVIIGSFFRGQGFNFVFPWNKRHLLRAVGATSVGSSPSPSSSSFWSPRVTVFVLASRRRGRRPERCRARRAQRDQSRPRPTSRRCPRRPSSRRPAANARTRPSADARRRAGAPARRRRRRVRAGRRGRARRHPPAVPQPRRARPRSASRLAGFGAGDARLPLAVPARAASAARSNVGKLDDILAVHRRATDSRTTCPQARTYIVQYPKDDAARRRRRSTSPIDLHGMEQGIVALYQRCVHLGCRVPWCQTSQWFECPCHGSKYNRVGEKKAGPAPAGSTASPLTVERRQRRPSTPATS